MLARLLDKDLPPFRRFVATLARPVAALFDSRVRAPIILRNASPARALSTAIYGRPSAAATTAAANLFAAPSCGAELLAIRFSGRSRDNMQGQCRVRVDFALRKHTEGRAGRSSRRVVSFEYDRGANDGFNGYEAFLNWAARESITIAKDPSGLWAWHSLRSQSPDDIVVQDWRLLALREGIANPDNQQFMALSCIPPFLALFFAQEEDQRDARHRRRAKAAALATPEREAARLARLVLSENIGVAVAMGDRLRLRAAAQGASGRRLAKTAAAATATGQKNSARNGSETPGPETPSRKPRRI